MSDHRPPEGHPVLRGLALWAVAAGVVVLAAAAFVLSYPGIHAVALQAGVSRSLARIYPAIFDAMLVIACAAVLSLRGGGLISRCYAWLSLLVLLAAAAGADTLHAIRIRPPHREAAAAAAIIPWALLLIGFGLLLAMLRHARLRRAAAATQFRGEPPRPNPPMAALPVGTAASARASDHQQRRTLPELPSVAYSGHEASQGQPMPALTTGSDTDHGSQDTQPAASANPQPTHHSTPNHGPADRSPAKPGLAGPEPDEVTRDEVASTEADGVLLAAPAEPGLDEIAPADPRPSEAAGNEAAPTEVTPTEATPGQAGEPLVAPDQADGVLLAAPAEPFVPQPRPEEPSGADRPVATAPFHRMWSTPTPPDDEEL